MRPQPRARISLMAVIAALVLALVASSVTPIGAATAAHPSDRATNGSISGSVTDGSGIAFGTDHLPEVALVEANTLADSGLHAIADASGDYTIANVPPGPYFVTFSGTAPPGPTAEIAYTEHWEESVTWRHASRVVVASGAAVSGIDAELGGITECNPLAPTTGPFPDVTPGSEPQFCDAIEFVAHADITTGYADGLFKPSKTVTRQSIAAFLFRYVGDPAFVAPSSPTFSDVPTTHPFFREIEWLADSGIANGYPDGTFRPGDSIARQAISAFLYRAAGEPEFTPPAFATFPDVPNDHPFFAEIEWMVENEITNGYADGNFRPGAATARRAMAYYLAQWDSMSPLFVPAFSVTTGSLPGATMGTLYSKTLATTNGTPPITWEQTAGDLPDGVTLSSAGVVAGTPTEDGSFSFTATATDNWAREANKELTLTVTTPPGPIVTTPSVPDAQQNIAFSMSLSASGGTPPYSWSITTGALPVGMSLAPSTGLLSGTPTALGTFTFSARVTDATPLNNTKSFTIHVTAPTGWPQPGHDDTRAGWSPAETMITPVNASTLGEEWTADVNPAATAIVDGVVYVAGNQLGDHDTEALVASDADTGDLLWSVGFEAATCTADGIAVSAAAVVVACGTGLRAYERTGDHALLWDTFVTDPGTDPASFLLTGSTYVAWSQSKVTAYRGSDGARLWQQLAPGDATIEDVAASGTRAVVAYSDRLRALNLSNGSQSWLQSGIVTPLVVIGGAWVYTSAGNGVRRFALADGSPGWNVRGGTGVQGVFAADGDTVYAWEATFDTGITSSTIRALDTADGSQRWEYSLGEWVRSIAVTGQVVWVVESGIGIFSSQSSVLHTLDRSDGSVRMTLPYDVRSYAPASVANGHVAFAAGTILHVIGFAPPKPEITTRVLRSAHAGAPSTQALAATGGLPPYTWSLDTGSLPSGVTLSPGGTLSGTAASASSHQIRVEVTDSRGRSDRQDLTFVVHPTGASSWLTSGGVAARSGLNPTEAVVNLDDAATLGPRWYTAIPPPPASGSPDLAREPVVKGNRVYDTGTDGVLRGWDTTGNATNRVALWTASAEADHVFTSGASEAGGTLFVVDNALTVYAISASDGHELWKRPLPSAFAQQTDHIRAPLVVGSQVFIIDDGGDIWAMSASTGVLGWGGTPVSLSDTNFIADTALSSDGIRIFAEVDCHVVAVTITTGVVAWSKDVFAAGVDACSPGNNYAVTVVGDEVFAGTFSNTFAFDAVTGALRWRLATGAAYSAAASNGVIVYPRWWYTGAMWVVVATAIDAETGERLWTADTVAIDGGVSIAGDLLLARTDAGLIGIDIVTGDVVFNSGSVLTAAYAHGAPAVGDGKIFLSTYANGVRVFGPP